MELFCREVGSGDRTVVIVHGLYGSSDNWLSIANALAGKFRIILPDLRNHGKSNHSSEHTYKLMANDLFDCLKTKIDSKIILLGHSMGGKVAMQLALMHPEIIEYLVVVDIAPKDYGAFKNYGDQTSKHNEILEALNSLNPQSFNTRQQMDVALAQNISDKMLRQFLLKNIKRHSEGNYFWQLNVKALLNNLAEIMDGFSSEEIVKLSAVFPTIFIKGEKSPYIKDEDTLVINRFFPNAQIVSINNAGHWVHAEQPELFINTLLYFIE
jgi:esterase